MAVTYFIDEGGAILANMNEGTTSEKPARALKVFLVEDCKALADRLGGAIGLIAGVNLIGVADSEAVAIAVALNDVDVIVLDLHLKQGTGFGVMRALATAIHKPIIIVLTNFDTATYKQAALAYGANHFLDKARDVWRLPDLLTEIRNQSSHRSDIYQPKGSMVAGATETPLRNSNSPSDISAKAYLESND